MKNPLAPQPGDEALLEIAIADADGTAGLLKALGAIERQMPAGNSQRVLANAEWTIRVLWNAANERTFKNARGENWIR